MAAMYVVILAGGGGTRLWPLSTPERPKPFLPLLGERSLLQLTVDRLLAGDELGVEPSDMTVVAAASLASLVRAQVPGVALLEEPEGRNTAAAIALAAMAIDRPDDEVMVVLPADQVIGEEGRFRAVLADAEAGIARAAFGVAAPLVTLGVETSRAATEYGYLIPGPGVGDIVHGLRARHLERFEEKPTAERAEQLRRQGGVAWNAGMFLWRRRSIRAALTAFAPDVVAGIEGGLAHGDLAQAYAAVRSTSIDYAVMEPAAAAGRVVMGVMENPWSDLGSWTALLEALGGIGTGRVVQPGEADVATADDLVVERVDGRLVVGEGPRGILGTTPIALLGGARPARDVVDALVDRVTRQETAP